jgi:pimeloyl-ACP methyl ester carboxylesterase
MPGASYDVGGHRLHLNCTGTGSPTVVLENGLSETSPLWSAITAQVSRTTRICAYDRVGQGWSDDVAHRQDGIAVAIDLHTLLARAGEHGPYVLAGHSSGGTLAMTNLTGHPAIGIKCGFAATGSVAGYTNGQPVVMMITGRLYEEGTIARVALAYEQASPWKDRHPTLP